MQIPSWSDGICTRSKNPLGSGGRLAELDELEGVLAVVVLSRSGVEDHDRFILGQPPRVSE